jgi:hypothetical protein
MSKPKPKQEGLIFQLPDGTTTRSAMKYVGAWRALADPLERVLEGRCVAFDPHLKFVFDGVARSETISLFLAQKIVARLKELESQVESAHYAAMGEDL